ncbi:MAG: prepilin-type N-terminal cleavage/methylation domain-containing protein, partial [Armatimonadetes bacterium]|nr:prepilin-type N-terminal cleavage/methylation domain-containing protein [Armatimonadota bacterium]NSW57845.1 prepilin-type N-terminal cleavage/methylation domain-containing protein [Armatimonadota bacterium]
MRRGFTLIELLVVIAII